MDCGRLSQVPPKVRVRVAGFEAGQDFLEKRFEQLGLRKGTWVEVIHRAPFGGDPLALLVNGALIAFLRKDLEHILVEREEGACKISN
jgi:Fe2+ transport system protein FeoA